MAKNAFSVPHSMIRHVTKRDGRREDFDPTKVHRVVEWAIEGLSNVYLTDIELAARSLFVDGVSTSYIQQGLIKAAADMITEDAPDYQWVASRLLIWSIRDEVWGGQSPPSFSDHVKNMVRDGRYHPDILDFSDEELETLGSRIDHDRDYRHTYAAMVWWKEKYLIQDRRKKIAYETPQWAYMAYAMLLFKSESNRVEQICWYYDIISKHKQNLATPPLCGVRSLLKQFASCVLIDMDDTLDSIGATTQAVIKYGAARAGIGVNIGRVRPEGSSVGHGEIVHTGLVPYLKLIESALRSTTQNGVRSASATIFYPFWHAEVETLVTLQNPTRGSQERKVYKLDYCIALSRLFYDRVRTGGYITLFNPHEAKGLFEAFGTPEFNELYERYEREAEAAGTAKRIPAATLRESLIQEMLETGRLYTMHIDHCNTHSSFIDTVRQSNLCLSGDTRLLTSDGYRPMRELWLEHGCREIGDVVEMHESQFVINENGIATSTPVVRTSHSSPLFKLTLSNGMQVRATAHHEFELTNGDRIRLEDVEVGMPLKISKTESFGIGGASESYAELAGHVIGDGSLITRNKTSQIACVRLWDDEIDTLGPVYSSLLSSIYDPNGSSTTDPDFIFKKVWDEEMTYFKSTVSSCSLGRLLSNDGVSVGNKHRIPRSIWSATRKVVAAFLRGIYTADGMIGCYGSSCYISLTQANKGLLVELQVLLSQFGVKSAIHPASEEAFMLRKDGKGGHKKYKHRKTWRLVISSRQNIEVFAEEIGVRQEQKMLKLTDWLLSHPGSNNSSNKYQADVVSIDADGEEETFCLTVPGDHQIIVNGIVTGQCLEITQPVIPIQSLEDQNGEIGICVLGAVNLGETSVDEFPDVARATVRSLDNLIDYQEYPIKAGEKFCKNWRSLGIGFTNFATWLVKMGIGYDHPDAPNMVSDLAEAWQYALLEASCELAKERGPCANFSRTKYARGEMPVDHYYKRLDKIVTTPPKKDWDALREKIMKYGLRHSTLTAQMPCESSSVIQNTTNGIEPPRSAIAYKKAKNGTVRQVLPLFDKRNEYGYAFKLNGNRGYLNCVAAIQKWFDMSISANLYFSYEDFEDQKIPLSVVADDMLYAYGAGIKTIYYTNTLDGDHQSSSTESSTTITDKAAGCESGACAL